MALCLAKISERGIVVTLLLIVFVSFMGIGLAFKRDIEICPLGVAIL